MLLYPPYLLISLRRKTYFLFSLVVGVVSSVLYWIVNPLWWSYIVSEQALLFVVLSSLFYAGVSFIRSSMVSTYRFKRQYAVDYVDNFTIGTNALVVTCTMLFVVSAFFIIFEVPFREFLTSVALFGVAIVLVFREYIINFFNSLYVLFTHYYFIGDWLSTRDGVVGRISGFTFRYVEITTPVNSKLFIPYARLLEGDYIKESRKARWLCHVGLPFEHAKKIPARKKRIIQSLAKTGIISPEHSVRVYTRSIKHDEILVVICVVGGSPIAPSKYNDMYELVHQAIF